MGLVQLREGACAAPPWLAVRAGADVFNTSAMGHDTVGDAVMVHMLSSLSFFRVAKRVLNTTC